MKDNKENKIIDDIAKLIGDALGALGSLKNETETFAQSKIDICLKKFNFVRREEYEVLEEMLVKARTEQEELKAKLDKLGELVNEKNL